MNINREQLICLAILVGTDYNVGGVKGLGQKRALEIVQKFENPVEIFEYVKKSDRYEINFDWQEIFQIFHEYTSQIENIDFPTTNYPKVKEILLNKDFSEARIDSGLDKLRENETSKKQKGLHEFF